MLRRNSRLLEQLSDRPPAVEFCVVDSSGQQDNDESTKLNRMDSKRITRKFGEKVRRDRMNSYITELASEVPVIASHPRRVDKATVLRLTVSYLKLHHGLKKKKLTQVWRPKFLTRDKILNALDEAVNGVLMIICKDGSILYVSSKVLNHLGHTQVDLMGSNIQTYLHPDDVEMFESQFTMADNNMNVFIENQSTSRHLFNTMQGQNRTFYVRFASSWKNDEEQVNYKMLHITASLLEDSEHSDDSSDGGKNVWMVAVCRPVSQALDQELSLTMSEFQKDNEWVSQHSLDGKILFSDNRFSLITGIMTSETRGKSPYLFLVMEDLDAVALSHSKIIDVNEIPSTIFRMKTVLGNEVYVESSSVMIMDSWTKKGKFIVSINRCLEEGEGRAKLAAQRAKVQELQGATERLSITSEKDEDENDKVSTFSSSCSSKSHEVSVTDPGYFDGSSNSSQSDCSMVDISNTNSKLCTCLSELHDTQASSGACSQFLTQMWQVQSLPFNRNQVSSASPTAETWTASPNADIQQNSPSSFIPAQKQNFLSLSTQSGSFDKFNNLFGNICHAGVFQPKLKHFSSAGDSSCGSCSNDDYHSTNSTSSSKWSASSSTAGKKRQRDSLDELDPLYGMALGATDSSAINLETDEKDEHSTKGIMGFCDCKYDLSNSKDYRPEVTKSASHSVEQHGMSRLRRLLESEQVLDGNKSFPVGIYGSSSSTLDTVEQHQLACERVPVPVTVQTHLSEQLQNKFRILDNMAKSQTESIKEIEHNLTQFSQEILNPDQQRMQKVLTSRLKTMEEEVEKQKQHVKYLSSKLDKADQHKCSDNTV